MLYTSVRVLISLLLIAVFVARAQGWIALSLVDVLENHVYDTRLRLTAEGGVDERIVIVDIDDRSLATEGQWHCGLDALEQLSQAGDRWR